METSDPVRRVGGFRVGSVGRVTSLDFFELDVFATGAFTGNPLAVICGADDLTDEQMQQIAAWTNFSETTFLLEPTSDDADYRVRIFTPVEEYDFAGHPTLGTAKAWLELGNTPRTPGQVVQECGVGNVQVRIDDTSLAFATPSLKNDALLDDGEIAEVCKAFGVAKQSLVAAAWGDNGPGWRLALLDSVETLRGLERAAESGLKVAFAALTGDVNPAYELRAFTPTFEDPVTGSANGAMAQWLRSRGDVPERYTVSQGTALGRNGRVEIADDGNDIWVGGAVGVRVRGQIVVD
ncbi:PhzF family phenazine biosynthesis protein [Corynebacterium lujinxingii]|uniref:PhzF family phenazine biosynthesis protein n=1 Tax=Corynebacterium lujinxingii TaxID=2763010 RepID=A0A7H0K1J2_9CORY|nr:PhzF family phenazine biosynthesis protein [Corynebacterium lujinxingii]NNO10448.1 PhzF family phenazine biosynthesis isomerase [Corynebacterium lujinxingii]QNP91158.1 PhzF family phenazine biosynthesis protein [Corynebacterium lujinxingii]